MKYILETDNNFCREYGTNVSEIIEKMYVIEDNLDFLLKEYEKQYPNEITTTRIHQFTNTKEILCDLDSANDEFYFYENDLENSIYIEVVTKEIAELNDKDFLRGEEEQDNYKLGETYSYYTKLADTEYYFRFM